METELDISAIVAEWGKFYRDEGQAAKDIKTKLFFEDDISQYFRRIPNASATFRSMYASIDEVLQAFSIPFTPKGTNTFKPWEQRLGEFKIDAKVVPDKLWPSYLGFLASKEVKERKNWPFIRWVIQEMLLPQSEEDFIRNVAYKGWQYSGFADVPTVSATTFVRELPTGLAELPLPGNASMDGMQTQIARMVEEGRVVPITVGAWTKNNAVTFCTEIEEFMQEVEQPLRGKIDRLFMSEDLYNLYVDGRREKYNLYWRQEIDLEVIDKTNARVTKSQSMEGSDQVWGTTPMNRVKPVKTVKNGRFNVQEFDRSVKMMNDWYLVNTVEVPEFVITSEHATVLDPDDYTVTVPGAGSGSGSASGSASGSGA